MELVYHIFPLVLWYGWILFNFIVTDLTHKYKVNHNFTSFYIEDCYVAYIFSYKQIFMASMRSLVHQKLQEKKININILEMLYGRIYY